MTHHSKWKKFIQTSSVNSNKRGRPTKDFSETSDRTRRRIANDSVDPTKYSMDRALLAAKRTVFNSNDSGMVKLISKIIEKQAEATKLVHQLNQSQMKTDEEAFRVLIDTE